MHHGPDSCLRSSSPWSAVGPLLLALALPCGAGCERLSAIVEAATGEPKKDAPKEAPAVPVVVGTAQIRDVQIWGEWIGTADGSVNAQIRPRVSGYLLSQNYTEGSLVRTGDLLFTIDPRPFEAALDHAKAALARTQAEQVKTQLDVDRLTPLVVKRAVSQQELDDAIAANKANLAMIKANEADIVDAELNLSFTRIIAPIDGIAGLANGQIGNLASPSSPQPLTTISTVDPIQIYYFATEQQYLKFMTKLGPASALPMDQRPTDFEIQLVDGTLFPQRGRFYFADREVDARTGSIRIAVRAANPGNLLRPGQYARIRAVIEAIKDAVVVPQRAVQDVQGSYQVAVVKPDNTIEIREVIVGSQTGGDWVVSKGLQGGETVVVEGLQKVRPGTKVAPQAAPPPNSPAAAGASGSPQRGASPPGPQPPASTPAPGQSAPVHGGSPAARGTATGSASISTLGIPPAPPAPTPSPSSAPAPAAGASGVAGSPR
jgi:membrane fusion protein (multidrug efflux system)